MLKRGIIKPKLRTRFIIKIGGMKRVKGKSPYPEKYDHFKLVYPEKDDSGDRIPVEEKWLMEQLGEMEPKELPFMFFSNDPRMCYDTGYAFQTRQGRRCFSEDGEVAFWARKKMEKKDNKFVEVVNPVPEGIKPIEDADAEGFQHLLDDYQPVLCLGQDCPMQKTNPPNCKLNVRLSGFIPLPYGRFEGQDIIWSTSYNTASQVEGSWATLMLQTGGKPAFVPLKLKLEPKKGKRGEIYILSFYADAKQDEINAIVSGSVAGTPMALDAGAYRPPSAVEMEDPEEFYESGGEEEKECGPSLAEMMPPEPPGEPEKPSQDSGSKEEKSAGGKTSGKERDVTPQDEPLDTDKMDMSNLEGMSEGDYARLDDLAQGAKFQMERAGKAANAITNAIQTAMRSDKPIKALEDLVKSFTPADAAGSEGQEGEQGELIK